MKQLVVKIFGKILHKIYLVFILYMNTYISKRIGKCGENAIVNYPFNIIGLNNIYLDDGVNIGPGATIYTKLANIYIGKKTFSGPNLTMISGDHPYIQGKYMMDISKDELSKIINVSKYDKDIIIEQEIGRAHV